MLWLMANPRPDSASSLFGCEKGLKDSRQDFGRNAGAVVAHHDTESVGFMRLKLVVIHRFPPCGIASMRIHDSASSTCSICAASQSD